MKNISVKCLGKKRKFDESLEKISTLESKINNKRNQITKNLKHKLYLISTTKNMQTIEYYVEVYGANPWFAKYHIGESDENNEIYSLQSEISRKGVIRLANIRKGAEGNGIILSDLISKKFDLGEIKLECKKYPSEQKYYEETAYMMVCLEGVEIFEDKFNYIDASKTYKKLIHELDINSILLKDKKMLNLFEDNISRIGPNYEHDEIYEKYEKKIITDSRIIPRILLK